MKDYHVLVLAMSTLPAAIVGRDQGDGTIRPMAKSRYCLKKDGKFAGPVYEGLGQLEVIPQFICDESGTWHKDITHILILETKECRAAISYSPKGTRERTGAEDTCKRVAEVYGGKELCMEGLTTISHTEFFKRRLAWLEIKPTFECIDIGVEDPSEGLEHLQKRIRELYSQCLVSKGDWKLWLDTHGGFRETSMAMFGLMQILAAPDEQELYEYTSDSDVAERDAIKRLSDGRDTVPVSGVYSVEFNPVEAMRGKLQPILDRTNFYSVFTKPAVEAYMNYGQYAQMVVRPNAIDDEGNVHPYAFISYRHLDAPQERYTFLGTLKREGLCYWFDDAIELQSKWSEDLRDRLNGCSVFVALVTHGYFDSYQCVKELRQALDEKKPIIVAVLDDTSFYDKKDGVSLKGAEPSDRTITITADEMSSITEKQQIALKKNMHEGVLQTNELVSSLEKLADDYPWFREIKLP